MRLLAGGTGISRQCKVRAQLAECSVCKCLHAREIRESLVDVSPAWPIGVYPSPSSGNSQVHAVVCPGMDDTRTCLQPLQSTDFISKAHGADYYLHSLYEYNLLKPRMANLNECLTCSLRFSSTPHSTSTLRPLAYRGASAVQDIQHKQH